MTKDADGEGWVNTASANGCSMTWNVDTTATTLFGIHPPVCQYYEASNLYSHRIGYRDLWRGLWRDAYPIPSRHFLVLYVPTQPQVIRNVLFPDHIFLGRYCKD